MYGRCILHSAGPLLRPRLRVLCREALHARWCPSKPLTRTTHIARAVASDVKTDNASAATPLHTKLQLQLHNTMTRQKEVFKLRNDAGNDVKMYVCGVTVYDYSHIGHARVYVVFDVLYRFLKHLGFDVTYVRNFTDIDDKIIARANQNGEETSALTERFIREFHMDMDSLGCLRPDKEPRATEFITEMLDMIQNIIKAGHAYEVEGDVYFDVQSLPKYGRLSGRVQEDNRAGERVAVDARKRNPADFALWKSAKPGEPSWTSPWGEGRPGWHLECSCMIRSLLGPVIDIHGGGQDLVFPHHENELAQSQAATCGCDKHSLHNGIDFVRYWVHNGFVNVDSEKMSKSLGNFFTIRDVLKSYHPLAVRWFLVNTQYRQPINYTQLALETASDRLYYVLQTLQDIVDVLDSAGDAGAAAKQQAATMTAEGKGEGAVLINAGIQGMLDDLNTPVVVSSMSAPLKAANDLMHTKAGKKQKDRLVTLASLQLGLLEVLGFLGLRVTDPAAVLNELKQYTLTRANLTEEEVQHRILDRAEARKEKNFAAADEVRQQLAKQGIMLQDTPQGTTWRPGLSPALEQAAQNA